MRNGLRLNEDFVAIVLTKRNGRKKTQTKTCSGVCQESKTIDCFSKRQWDSNDTTRKCLKCMSKKEVCGFVQILNARQRNRLMTLAYGSAKDAGRANHVFVGKMMVRRVVINVSQNVMKNGMNP